MHELRTSRAGRWVKCPSSASRESKEPNEPNDAALEGIAAHELLEKCLRQSKRAEDFKGQRAENGVLFDDDMIEHVNNCVDFVHKKLTIPESANLLWGIEHPIEIKTLKSRIIHGRCDLWIYDTQTRHLTIIDFKYGWGIVSERENWQFIGYGYGIVLWLLDNGYELPESVSMICMQPRPAHRDGPFREWRINFKDFKRYASALQRAADNTYDRPNSLAVGPWCTDCLANTKCEALRHSGLALIDRYDGESVNLDLPAAQLSQELEILRRASGIIKDRCDALETAIMQRMSKGERFPNWTISQTFGRSDWTNKDVGINIGSMFGVTTHKVVPLTPNQAIKAGVPESIVNKFSAKNPTGMKLVNEDAVERARKAFKNE